jgi:hypothetical protein
MSFQQIPTHAQQVPQQAQQIHLKKRKKPNDKNLSKKIEAFVPESKLYLQMQDFERRLDATITRKTLDIQDALVKPQKVFSTKHRKSIEPCEYFSQTWLIPQISLTGHSKLKDVYCHPRSSLITSFLGL